MTDQEHEQDTNSFIDKNALAANEDANNTNSNNKV